MKKTILVSGANGYIALHLIQALKSVGYQVVTASRTNTSDLYMDFCNPEQIALLKAGEIDAMIHTVSPNEALFKTDIYRAVAENATGIHAALDFCVNNGIQNFIYFSSFHVFGHPEGLLNENTQIAPGNDYGLAHSIAEQTVQLYNRQGRLNAWVVRPSNVFGKPKDANKFKRWSLLPFAFCKEAVQNHTITLYSTGEQLRNFVDVQDVCKKTIWILQNAPAQRVVHIFGQETLSIYQYAQQVQQAACAFLGVPVQIVRPQGTASVVQFQFESTLKMPHIEPTGQLHIFITEIMQMLNPNPHKQEGR